jgi:hypothetical protein
MAMRSPAGKPVTPVEALPSYTVLFENAFNRNQKTARAVPILLPHPDGVKEIERRY